ncbi:hypothetical protein CGMCC3_g11759 [Colletotrichum fructicola]|uniref:Uncharacterized protein n=1 Tax=Colletotrichum fructicola (strain Nara gc5) TaxID=1213859 RepID=L2G689_COLFN|nr:uncharacterized protein CGMCC3_g11759 [Colletotrichum fructicola]KAF4481075.1 hypothetical protein CGGC5_v010508 [Colletotrichum fructicola Nara gc5]KAE9572042.1 hypothetical protein CGMCC3_g11759 [Colletotrichum fructicola]KAF4420045.1 hypothetical protein CFRS1_v014875 [Colletotrichum fructicola]KAF4882927.1 hypothetical protein CGCFRS4_v014093 [Colletotrichum fructicola]KAF4927048.1 hypothetical protein CGCF245_v013340 [Colletotrichum fructicola]
MKTSNLITALALGVVAYGIPVAEDPANKELLPAGPDTWTPAPADSVSLGNLASIDLSNIQPVADNVNVEERGLAPATIAGPTFHPAWLPRVRPAAQAITIAGHALLMTAWVDAQNRICIILDAAFPGLHGTIIAGVQNLHNNLAVLPHVFELGKTYVAPDNQAEIQPGDTWRWFWFK